jgi:hypothetical protein
MKFRRGPGIQSKRLRVASAWLVLFEAIAFAAIPNLIFGPFWESINRNYFISVTDQQVLQGFLLLLLNCRYWPLVGKNLLRSVFPTQIRLLPLVGPSNTLIASP